MKKIILLITLGFCCLNLFSQIGVMISDSTAFLQGPQNPNTILEVRTALPLGVMLPKCTEMQRMGIPLNQSVDGLIMYQSDSGFYKKGYYYAKSTSSGIQWVPFQDSIVQLGSGWMLSGNSGTNPSYDFIGTVDNADFVIRTNNIERLRILESGNIGIGTTSPLAKLEIIGNSGMVCKGNLGLGIVPHVGPGTRMMWIPAKASFRAGITTSNEWDSVNIGIYSAAFGVNTKASGSGSFAIGNSSVAQGLNSFSGGDLSESLAGHSFSFGYHARALADHSISIGDANNSNHPYCVSVGSQNISSGDYSVTIGAGNITQMENSIAIGSQNVASHLHTVAIGQENISSGSHSYCYGEGLISNSCRMMSIGQFNIGAGTNLNSPVLTDPAFEFGIGTSAGSRANAITILKNGFIGIATSAPKTMVHVQNGDMYIEKNGGGVYMKSPNGNCWLVSVTNAGILQVISVTCP